LWHQHNNSSYNGKGGGEEEEEEAFNMMYLHVRRLEGEILVNEKEITELKKENQSLKQIQRRLESRLAALVQSEEAAREREMRALKREEVQRQIAAEADDRCEKMREKLSRYVATSSTSSSTSMSLSKKKSSTSTGIPFRLWAEERRALQLSLEREKNRRLNAEKSLVAQEKRTILLEKQLDKLLMRRHDELSHADLLQQQRQRQRQQQQRSQDEEDEEHEVEDDDESNLNPPSTMKKFNNNDNDDESALSEQPSASVISFEDGTTDSSII